MNLHLKGRLLLSVCLVNQLSRVKAEARLALLSEIVTGSELWLHNAMNQAEEELERERRLSEQRKSTEEFSVCKHNHTHTHTHTHACMPTHTP